MLAIYTRLSKEDEESNSIENQTREGKAFAKANGFHEYELYNEGEGISGVAEIEDRPELMRLLSDMRNEKVTAVWFRHQNRLERNSATFAVFKSVARKKNVRIFFNSKELDLYDVMENAQTSFMSIVGEINVALQGIQTKKSLLDNVKEGKAWSIIPYGYKTIEGYLVINELEAKVVKRIYKESLEGIGTDRIAKRLNKDNIPTRKGADWRGRTVQGIIKSTLYKGLREWGRTESIKKNNPSLIKHFYFEFAK